MYHPCPSPKKVFWWRSMRPMKICLFYKGKFPPHIVLPIMNLTIWGGGMAFSTVSIFLKLFQIFLSDFILYCFHIVPGIQPHHFFVSCPPQRTYNVKVNHDTNQVFGCNVNCIKWLIFFDIEQDWWNYSSDVYPPLYGSSIRNSDEEYFFDPYDFIVIFEGEKVPSPL